MSFPNTITIKNAANVDSVFIRLDDDKVQSTYVLSTATLSEPVHLIIRKDMTKSANGVDRYLVKFQATVLSDGVPCLATRNESLAQSRNIPRATTDNLVAWGKNFHTSDNVTMMLRGEI